VGWFQRTYKERVGNVSSLYITENTSSAKVRQLGENTNIKMTDIRSILSNLHGAWYVTLACLMPFHVAITKYA
jgi:hypothetical protein